MSIVEKPNWEEKPAKSPAEFCAVCLLPATLDVAEQLLLCAGCSNKVHPSCLRYSAELADRCRSSPWHCANCRTCQSCGLTGKPSLNQQEEEMLICDGCDKGWHSFCAAPLIGQQIKTNASWRCASCSTTMDQTASPPPALAPAISPYKEGTPKKPCVAQSFESKFKLGVLKLGVEQTFPNCDCESNSPLPDLTVDQRIRDCAKDLEFWSTEKVGQFLAQLGFSAQIAAIFMEQEIDGEALLLLKRADILSSLELKLGPALKLYRYIFALQAVAEQNVKTKLL